MWMMLVMGWCNVAAGNPLTAIGCFVVAVIAAAVD